MTRETRASTGGAQSDATTTLYIARHGRTELNAAGRLRGHRDVPLDQVGRNEADALGRLFATVPLSRILSSPLARAVATAAAIAATTRAAVTIDDRLVDRDYGAWSGKRRAEIEQQFGSLDEAPGVERSDSVAARAVSVVSDIHAAYAGQRILIVAHDVVNRLLIGRLCNLGDGAELAQTTGCWNLITACNGRWSLAVAGAVPGDGQTP